MRTILFAVLITLSLATNAQKLLLLADEIPASSLSFEQRERLDTVESDELASEIKIGRFSLETLRTMRIRCNHLNKPTAWTRIATASTAMRRRPGTKSHW